MEICTRLTFLVFSTPFAHSSYSVGGEVVKKKNNKNFSE